MTRFDLADYVKNSFDGMLVFADVHGDFDSFMKAYSFAVSENYFLMSLGDLVDRSDKPYEIVTKMSDAVYNGRAGFIIGNHDDKYLRLHKGNNVRLSLDGRRTMESVGESRKDEFLNAYTRMMNDNMFSGLYHIFDDIILTHAASHPDMWSSSGKFSSSAKSRALYGETNGKLHSDGYPVRLYNWIEEIPMGKTVIVGHDRMPIFNVPMTTPIVKNNANGGCVMFTDTGCGKGGFLTGTVILHDGKKFKFDKFVEFK